MREGRTDSTQVEGAVTLVWGPCNDPCSSHGSWCPAISCLSLVWCKGPGAKVNLPQNKVASCQIHLLVTPTPRPFSFLFLYHFFTARRGKRRASVHSWELPPFLWGPPKSLRRLYSVLTLLFSPSPALPIIDESASCPTTITFNPHRRRQQHSLGVQKIWTPAPAVHRPRGESTGGPSVSVPRRSHWLSLPSSH